MATNKQCKMMLARAGLAGIKTTWDELAAFENGQVDEFLEKCNKASEGVMKKANESAGEPRVGINNVRLGLAVKMILQKQSIGYCIENETWFKSKVTALYNLMERTEEAVKASSSGA